MKKSGDFYIYRKTSTRKPRHVYYVYEDIYKENLQPYARGEARAKENGSKGGTIGAYRKIKYKSNMQLLEILNNNIWLQSMKDQGRENTEEFKQLRHDTYILCKQAQRTNAKAEKLKEKIYQLYSIEV